jgi:hypothetical protein
MLQCINGATFTIPPARTNQSLLPFVTIKSKLFQ